MTVIIEDFRKYLKNNPHSIMQRFKDAQGISMRPETVLTEMGYKFYTWYSEDEIGIKKFMKVENGVEKYAYYPEVTWLFEYPIVFVNEI